MIHEAAEGTKPDPLPVRIYTWGLQVVADVV